MVAERGKGKKNKAKKVQKRRYISHAVLGISRVN
jgi:hypothetical protein